MRTYFEQMIALRDRFASRANDFGNFQIQTLIIRRRDGEGYRYEQVTPNPVITERDPTTQTVEGVSNLSGTVRIFDVKGVSRKYQDLERDGTDFIVNGELRLGEVKGGVPCVVVISTEKAITWDLVLQHRVGEQNFY